MNTDAVPAEESGTDDSVQNMTEANLIQQFSKCLLYSGVQEDQVGIISLYPGQVKLLSHLLRDHKGVEVLSADRMQGEKACIILSLVRSNGSSSVSNYCRSSVLAADLSETVSQISDVAKDWERITVSFTHARSKLVVFGSRKILEAAPMREFLQLMENRKWTILLPRNADNLHNNLYVHNPRKRLMKQAADEEPAQSDL